MEKKMCEKYTIGYWISEKKRQKFNWNHFYNLCEAEGFQLKMMDIDSDLESQGPFHVFIHKLTPKLALAERGDQNAKAIISKIEEYFCRHPKIIVIDPLENIKILINRYKYYELIREHIQFNDVFTPKFVEIKTKDTVENISLLKKANIKFPIICKPLIALGSSDAHKMMVIFNEEELNNCQPPCVAQEFINHNAIVYKIYIVREHYYVDERPSFKNFYEEDCTSLNTIFFNSLNIFKSGSTSKWSILSEENIPLTLKPKQEVLEKIVNEVSKLFGLILLGVDVVIENHTGRYAIIDVNVFPGYVGYPNFFEQLIGCVRQLLVEQQTDTQQHSKSYSLKKCLSDDLDSGFESDEKKKCSTKTTK
ncbi:inositol-tetrakisphosphate 1-kinase [Megalopta genalis]|uniref:inositol-tetrakisphosphate 1-kinase n=1 Tax=Megalopta genalis TaxID=115081 RepID=UPI003FD29567